MKKRIAFFDTKPYDKVYFDKYNKDYEICKLKVKFFKLKCRACLL